MKCFSCGSDMADDGFCAEGCQDEPTPLDTQVLMIPKITVTATYDTVEWKDEEDGCPSEEPIETGGFTDPENPWGGWKTELPQGTNPPPEWYDSNVKRVTFDTAWEAAEFILDFPGGVLDYSEGEGEQDLRTGVWTRVTLHVEGGQEWIFELCDRIAKLRVDGKRRVH